MVAWSWRAVNLALSVAVKMSEDFLSEILFCLRVMWYRHRYRRRCRFSCSPEPWYRHRLIWVGITGTDTTTGVDTITGAGSIGGIGTTLKSGILEQNPLRISWYISRTNLNLHKKSYSLHYMRVHRCVTLTTSHSIAVISSVFTSGVSSIVSADSIDGAGTKVGVGTRAESTPVPILLISFRTRYRLH